MNEKVRVLLVLVFAFLAALITYRLLGGLRETVTVVVATVDIPAGTLIEPSMVSTMNVGKRDQEVLMPNVIRQPEQVIGRAPKRSIQKGAALNMDPDEFRLTDEAMKQVTGGEVPPAYLIPPGLVAIAVPVDAASSVGFALRKGDLVNVLFTWKRGEEALTKTVLSNVEVFDVGKAEGGLSGAGPNALKTVTLLVTPVDAEQVTLAKRTGTVDLALVGK